MTERPSRLARALPVVAMAALSVLLVLLVFEVSLRLTQDLVPEGVAPDPAASLFMFSENKAVGFEHAPNVFVNGIHGELAFSHGCVDLFFFRHNRGLLHHPGG